MPTIEISYQDLCNLIGKKIPIKELEKEGILFVKGEFEEVDGDRIKLEIADTNRPDLWSVEGIARELKTKYNVESGAVNYTSKKSGLKLTIDKNLKKIRPLTVCAVIKGINVSEEMLFQIIQLQEKVCETFGRNRDQAAIGVYDYDKITGPITYKAFDPDKTKFQPLDYPTEVTLRQILSKHPKGKEYGHLLEGFDKYPLFIDSAGEVLSMPPVINSDHTGKVTKDTHNLFIECSGHDLKFIVPALNVIVSALIDRGGKLETVEIEDNGKTTTSPDFSLKEITVSKELILKMLGKTIPDKEIIQLLKGARFDIKEEKESFKVYYAPYRQDIMHPMDIVEDILIGYGFNNIVPESPMILTGHGLIEEEQFARDIADIMVGLSCQEVMSYTLTNKDYLFKNMNLDPETQKIIEIDNAVSKNWCVFRTWITPQILEIFSKNTNREYPQQIFEIGQVVIPDEKAETRAINPIRIAWGIIDKNPDFTTAKQVLDFLMDSLGVSYEIIEAEHDSFIPGRCGRVIVNGKKIAYIGEIHPQVLNNWKLDYPVAAFELNLTELYKAMNR